MGERRLLLFWAGCALLAGFVVAAALAPLLSPYDPSLPVGRPLLTPTRDHPLGTNDIGQDVLSRLLHGARTSLVVAAAVAVVSTALSWVVGLVAGFIRAAEGPLMALVDLLLALPAIPLYLLVVTLIGPGRFKLILMLALLSWPAFARVIRSIVIQTRSAPYVEAARALGPTGAYIVRRHILPPTLDMLPAKLILTVRFAVFAEATLAFLGLAASGSVSWGTMLGDAFNDPLLFSRPVWPWLVLPPTVAIMALVLATTWLSSGLESLPGRSRRALSPAAPVGTTPSGSRGRKTLVSHEVQAPRR